MQVLKAEIVNLEQRLILLRASFHTGLIPMDDGNAPYY
jgi:hypothetical protein